MEKVLFILPPGLPVPAFRGGAIESLVTELIDENEIHHKYNFIVICKEDKDAILFQRNYKYTEFVALESKCNSMIIRIASFGSKVLRKTLGVYIPVLSNYNKQINKYILQNKNKIDYIINESNNFYALYPVAKKIGKEKILAHLHYEIKSDKILDKTYGHIISISQYIENVWKKKSKRPDKDYTVIKNGIVLENFNKKVNTAEKKVLYEQLNLRESDFIIFYCGRIVPQKGVKELIEAILMLGDDVKLIIIGNPNFSVLSRSKYLSDVISLVEKNNEQIKFTGYVSNDQIYKYYSISNIQVIPSIYEEPAGLVCIEGMAAGIPVLATDSGGIWEYLSKDISVMIKRDYKIASNIADAICLVKNNYDMYKEKAILGKELAKGFSKQSYYKNFYEFIEKYKEKLKDGK